MPRLPPDKKTETIKDLGFGAKVLQNSVLRLLNRDGTFNVSRTGLPLFKSLNIYQILLNISWFFCDFSIYHNYLILLINSRSLGLGYIDLGLKSAHLQMDAISAYSFCLYGL